MKIDICFFSLLLSFVCVAQQLSSTTIPEWWENIGVTLGVEYRSSYNSKGRISNPDPVLYHSFHLSYENWYFGGSWVMDTTNYHKESETIRSSRKFRFYEAPVRVGFNHIFRSLPYVGNLTLDCCSGVNYYPGRRTHRSMDYPIICSVRLNNLMRDSKWILSPSLLWYYYTKHDRIFFYQTLRLGYVFSKRYTLMLTNTVYWGNSVANKSMYSESRAGNTAAELKLDLTCTLNRHLSVKPYLAMGIPLRHYVRKKWLEKKYNSDVNYWCGVSVVYKW